MNPICPTCGYDLTGQAVVDAHIRCPECGKNEWAALCTRGPSPATFWPRALLVLIGAVMLAVAVWAWSTSTYWALGVLVLVHFLVGLRLGVLGWDSESRLEGVACYCLALLLATAATGWLVFYACALGGWLAVTAAVALLGGWIGERSARRSTAIEPTSPPPPPPPPMG